MIAHMLFMIQNNATVLKWGQKNEVPETHQYQDTSTPSFLKRKGISAPRMLPVQFLQHQSYLLQTGHQTLSESFSSYQNRPVYNAEG